MYACEVKQVIFQGKLQPRHKSAAPSKMGVGSLVNGEEDKPLLYSILAQHRREVDDPENSPSVSMWPYLLVSAQTQRLNEVSVYVERGESAEHLRFLYLNDFALTIWGEMNKNIQVLGRLHRPPRSATLSFGMPFSE